MSETHGAPSDHHPTPELPEPKTPMWLPALGAFLFLTAGVVWGLMPASKNETGTPSDASTMASDAGSARAH